MTNPAAGFGVNTYSYTFGSSAADTVARLADQGYGGVELMFFPAISGRPSLMHQNSAACAISARRACGSSPSTCPMST